jgi:hypothetical protein
MNLEKDSRQAFNMKRLTRNVQGRNGEDGTTTARGPRALQFGDSTARYLHNRHRALQSEVGTERTAGPAFATSAQRGRVSTSLRLYQRLVGEEDLPYPPDSAKRSQL